MSEQHPQLAKALDAYGHLGDAINELEAVETQQGSEDLTVIKLELVVLRQRLRDAAWQRKLTTI
jgi:hypothetical protein